MEDIDIRKLVEELTVKVDEQGEIIELQAQANKTLREQNERDRQRWRLEKIEMMQRLTGKEGADILDHIETTKEKIRYILDYYGGKYPNCYKSSMLMSILIWTEIEGVPRAMLKLYRNKELSNFETVSRTLRKMKEEGEICDPEHNKRRYRREQAYRQVMKK